MKTLLALAAVAAFHFFGLVDSAAAQGAPVKIGVLYPTKTLNGKQSMQGAAIAAEMLNASGGILKGRRVQLIGYDTNLSPVEGVAAVQRLIDQDNAKLIAGELGSSVALAVVPVVKAEGALFVAAAPKHPDVTRSGYDRVFRLNSTTAMDAAAFDPLLKSKAPAGKKVALIAENNDYGHLTTESFRKLFGSQVVFSELFALTQTDFSSLVSNLKQANPDLVCIASSNVEQWSNILRTMTDLKVAGQRCIYPGLLSSEGVRLAGKAAEGVFSADIYTADLDNEINRKFVSAYTAKYGKRPEKLEALGFESVWIIANAADRAATADDPVKIAAAIRSGSWSTPRGTVKFDPQGQGTTEGLMKLEVRDGMVVQVK